MKACPCGSGKDYSDCCAPLHKGEVVARSAEALMRSRYSAYVLKNSVYLSTTWHSSSRPAALDVNADETPWQRLSIIATEKGRKADTEGTVEFVAYFSGGQLHELSRFVKEEGNWFYLDGKILPPVVTAKVGRNDPCPCGSGQKYKKCCGA